MLLNTGIPFKYIFNKIKTDVIIIFTIGLITNLLSSAFPKRYLPEVPTYIPAVLGTAISILLSFKMNQSYDRWWEARKVWGAIVNDSRTFVLQLQAFLGANHPAIRALAFKQIAFCYSLGRSLRGLDATEDIEEFLSEQELATIKQHNNKPLAILQLCTLDIKKIKDAGVLDIFYHTRLDDTLRRLCDSMGKAERIKSTVFPATYRLFLHFIIYVFAVTFSVALQDIAMVFEIPLVVVISSCFFLIEKSAFHLQDPFSNRPSDISVTAIARTIEINLRQLVADDNVPAPAQPVGFYLM